MEKEIDEAGLIESALFMAGRSVDLKEIKEITGIDSRKIPDLMKELHEKWEDLEIPLQIVENEEGWKMRVKDRYLPYVHTLSSLTDLTDGEMKTLAVVAYYQPITQADIVKIRGNRAYEHLRRLEGLGMLSSRPSGNTKILETTSRFKDYFGDVKSEDPRELLKRMDGSETKLSGKKG